MSETQTDRRDRQAGDIGVHGQGSADGESDTTRVGAQGHGGAGGRVADHGVAFDVARDLRGEGPRRGDEEVSRGCKVVGRCLAVVGC